MPCICYVTKAFRPDTLAIIQRANKVIVDYQRQGFKLTLRQLYYQFVAKDLLPDSWIDAEYNAKHGLPPDTKNTLKNYKHLGDIINDGRLAGLIDWLPIEDRTRNLQCTPRGPVRTPSFGPVPINTPWTFGPSRQPRRSMDRERGADWRD